MSSRSPALPALLIALLACVPAWADEPTTAASPTAAYAAKAASLPAPSAELGFRFDGVLRVNGNTLGHATLFARPDPKNTATWRTGDMIVVRTRAQPTIEIAEAFFTRTLGLLRGAVESNKPGDSRITWVKTETGFRGTTGLKEGEVTTEKVRNFEHTGPATTTLSGTILFARMALPEKASYATTIFEVENGMKGEKVLHAATLEVLGEGELNGKKVLTVRARKGEQTLELLFAPEGKELVAVRMEEGKQRIELLKGDMWSMPAQDPVTASMRAALAFGTGDVALLDSVIHWPSFYESVKKQRAAAGAKGEAPKIEDFRKSLIAQWTKTLPKNPPEMIRGVLVQMRAQLTATKLGNGDVEVLYPPVFRNLKLTLSKEYGFWHLVALPGVGKPAPTASPEKSEGEAPPKKDAPKKPEPAKSGAPKDG